MRMAGLITGFAFSVANRTLGPGPHIFPPHISLACGRRRSTNAMIGAITPPSARIRKAGAHIVALVGSILPLYHCRMVPKTAGETTVIPNPTPDWRPRQRPQILGFTISTSPALYTDPSEIPQNPSHPAAITINAIEWPKR